MYFGVSAEELLKITYLDRLFTSNNAQNMETDVYKYIKYNSFSLTTHIK